MNLAKLQEEEKLLARLADAWHQYRTGSPGLHWLNARKASPCRIVAHHLTSSQSWSLASSGKDVFAAWLTATSNDMWTPEHFDCWAEVEIPPEQKRTLSAKTDARREFAKKERVATTPAALLEKPFDADRPKPTA